MNDQLIKNLEVALAVAKDQNLKFQWRYPGSEWRDNTTTGPILNPDYFATDGYELRLKPAWSLPAPPAGREWHRADWTEEMLPEGWRPLLKDEKVHSEDSRSTNSGRSWHDAHTGDIGLLCNWESVFYRTRRPLPRPWSKPEDVPGPVCWLRYATDQTEMLITCVFMNGLGCRDMGSYQKEISWSGFVSEKWQHSTDRKTWHPCTVEDNK